MAPDLNHLVVYSTTSLASTKYISAYYELPLCVGKVFITANDVVLDKKGYSVLIGTQLAMYFDVIFKHKEGFVFLLGYCVPLVPVNASVTKGLHKRYTFLLE